MAGPARPLLACLLAALALLLVACGDSDESSEELTPEEVAAKLQDEGYETGEVITDGANVGVARSGKLDADAYLSVDYAPDGSPLYVGIYFFGSEEDAAVLAEERERNEDRDFDSQLVGTKVFEISGDPNALTGVVAAVEAP